MEKKTAQPRERNKEKSKQRFLDAVGTILETKGFAALKVNDIAATAGLDKKLIYNYFGGTEQLIEAYISSKDFWSNVSMEALPSGITDGGLDILKRIFTSQFDAVQEDKELQKILLWGITEKRVSLQKIAALREEIGEQLLTTIIDPHFGTEARAFRAAAALMVSGIYYLNLYTDINAKTFGGIDLTTEEGRQDIKSAIEMMLDLLYSRSKSNL
ncbi:TetR/AcrR family transcriptional regulator [Taibaiella sp. KBW10]|uniref:TetR/AcrR family transcriptional regulator n=1 Tax=Taibaiella sp. KBW10 TaxID=2153357 RepID=UPI000F5A6518|nr:TetR/AcrR family transcriptional regulator [Taibaiella sp. KBW10]RQO31151.1 TetR/AcrR family transcriptional regulator [Taibaiella sp. KBW10]